MHLVIIESLKEDDNTGVINRFLSRWKIKSGRNYI